MYFCMILFVCINSVVAKHHIIRLTAKLRQQGYHGDITLGEVIAEALVDSPAACGRLCEDNPVCHSVMLAGQLCRMFAASQCPVSYCLIINDSNKVLN